MTVSVVSMVTLMSFKSAGVSDSSPSVFPSSIPFASLEIGDTVDSLVLVGSALASRSGSTIVTDLFFAFFPKQRKRVAKYYLLSCYEFNIVQLYLIFDYKLI